jgi:hypothetical protein
VIDHSSGISVRRALVVLATACVISTTAVGSRGLRPAASDQSAAAASVDRGDAAIPVVPKRRAPDRTPPLPPPLPVGADGVTPLTLDVTIRQRTSTGGHVRRQTVTRTADRIHLAAASAPHERTEWLFQRNPVDPRRVSGFLIDHAARSIVFHSESDLRHMLAIPGWTHVLTLGFDPGVLSGVTASDEARILGGIRFTRYSRRDEGRERVDVWWSADQLVASRFTSAGDTGTTALTIERIRMVIDPRVLDSPASRFPQYGQVDLADWLEHR